VLQCELTTQTKQYRESLQVRRDQKGSLKRPLPLLLLHLTLPPPPSPSLYQVHRESRVLLIWELFSHPADAAERAGAEDSARELCEAFGSVVGARARERSEMNTDTGCVGVEFETGLGARLAVDGLRGRVVRGRGILTELEAGELVDKDVLEEEREAARKAEEERGERERREKELEEGKKVEEAVEGLDDFFSGLI
jgi:hypothetical protein